MHITITRGKCDGCGYMSDCFSCSPVLMPGPRPKHAFASVQAYRNTILLQYRKFKM